MTVIPANVDAERSVLGAILSAASLDVDAGHRLLDRVYASGLEPTDFWLESHGVLFALLVRMRMAGLPVDPISVADELDRDGGEPFARGRLEVLAHEVTAFSNAEHHARIVAREARRRRCA